MTAPTVSGTVSSITINSPSQCCSGNKRLQAIGGQQRIIFKRPIYSDASDGSTIQSYISFASLIANIITQKPTEVLEAFRMQGILAINVVIPFSASMLSEKFTSDYRVDLPGMQIYDAEVRGPLINRDGRNQFIDLIVVKAG